MKNTKLLIVDPSRLSREGFRLLLSDAPYDVQDTAGFDDFARMTDVVVPELIIWCAVSISAIISGLAACRARFADVAHPVRHVILASDPNPRMVRRLDAMGIDALLLVDISKEVLQRSLELVMLGQRLFPTARKAVSAASRAEVLSFPLKPRPVRVEEPGGPEHAVVLSGREGQILRLLIRGASNKAIAREMLITEATVKVHIKGLLRKARVANRTQAAIWGLHNRYTVVGETEVPSRDAADLAGDIHRPLTGSAPPGRSGETTRKSG